MFKKICLASIIAISVSGFSRAQYHENAIPIEIIDNDIFVKVFVNERGPYNFILDTGASGIGRIDERIVKELDLRTIDSTKNFDGSGSYKVLPNIGIDRIKLGDIEMRDVKLLSRDYNVKPKKDALLTDGVIGRDFFLKYLLTIDCPNKNLHYSNSSLDKQSAGVLSYNEPFKIQGSINGKDTDFHIDTGSNMAMHFPKSLIDGLSHTNTGKRGIARKANSEYFIIQTILHENIEIGLIKVRELTVDYSKKATYVNVGTEFLKNYKITIDQRNNLFKIE